MQRPAPFLPPCPHPHRFRTSPPHSLWELCNTLREASCASPQFRTMRSASQHCPPGWGVLWGGGGEGHPGERQTVPPHICWNPEPFPPVLSLALPSRLSEVVVDSVALTGQGSQPPPAVVKENGSPGGKGREG